LGLKKQLETAVTRPSAHRVSCNIEYIPTAKTYEILSTSQTKPLALVNPG
jgi:hypothetical protein